MNSLKLGEIFKEEIKILNGFDTDYRPIIEDAIMEWTIIEIDYSGRYFIGKNIYGEKKGFPLD